MNKRIFKLNILILAAITLLFDHSMAAQISIADIINDDVQKVKAAISSGADVNSRYNTSTTALHYAAKYDSIEVAMLLIDSGADINAYHSEDGVPLRIAVINCNMKIVELLLGKGAIIDYDLLDYLTKRASKKCNTEMLALLVEYYNANDGLMEFKPVDSIKKMSNNDISTAILKEIHTSSTASLVLIDEINRRKMTDLENEITKLLDNSNWKIRLHANDALINIYETKMDDKKALEEYIKNSVETNKELKSKYGKEYSREIISLRLHTGYSRGSFKKFMKKVPWRELFDDELERIIESKAMESGMTKHDIDSFKTIMAIITENETFCELESKSGLKILFNTIRVKKNRYAFNYLFVTGPFKQTKDNSFNASIIDVIDLDDDGDVEIIFDHYEQHSHKKTIFTRVNAEWKKIFQQNLR